MVEMNIKITADAETKTIMNVSFYAGIVLGGICGFILGMLVKYIIGKQLVEGREAFLSNGRLEWEDVKYVGNHGRA